MLTLFYISDMTVEGLRWVWKAIAVAWLTNLGILFVARKFGTKNDEFLGSYSAGQVGLLGEFWAIVD